MFGALLEHAKLAGETAKAIEAEIRRIAFTQGVVPEEANLIAEPARARLANGEPVGLLRVHFRLVGEAGAYLLAQLRRHAASRGSGGGDEGSGDALLQRA